MRTRSSTKNKTTTTNTPTTSTPKAPKKGEIEKPFVERKPPPIINLKSRFGNTFRIRKDDGHTTENPLLIIPCRYGHIYPHGHNILAVSVDGHSGIAASIRRLACCTVSQDGDFGELTALFNVDDIGKVAAIMKPYRKRKLSEEAKAKASERLKKIHARKANQEPSAASDK